MSRPRILFLSQCLPYPPHSGVTNRIFHVLREVARDFDIHLLPFYRRNHQSTADAVARSRAQLGEIVREVAKPVPIPAEHARLRRLWDHLRSVISGEPYVYFEYYSEEFRSQFERTKLRSYDLIHSDSLDLYRWLPFDDDASPPIACVHHSIESELLRLRADVLENPLTRAYVRYQAELMEHRERDLCPAIDVNIMMSVLDAKRLRELAPGASTAVVPNGVDTEFFVPRPRETNERIVLFIGPTYMLPNRDAVFFFLERIWPRIHERDPEAFFVQVGKCPDEVKVRLERHPNARSLGYVEDIREVIADAVCTIVPLRVGGGTRLKILDAWAMGRSVVATTVGAEGLEYEEGHDILIRDDPEAFADAVLQLLRDEALRSTLEGAGRRRVQRTYSWTRIGGLQRQRYRELLGGAPTHD